MDMKKGRAYRKLVCFWLCHQRFIYIYCFKIYLTSVGNVRAITTMPSSWHNSIKQTSWQQREKIDSSLTSTRYGNKYSITWHF